MQIQKIVVPLLSVAGVVLAYRAYGWGGVAVATGALVMWLLLHFTRAMQVLKRASDRPIGFVDSTVMLNAKLRPGVNLLHVVAMTRALGERLSPQDSQPEVYRWTDDTHSTVTCEFHHGKLTTWTLWRPSQDAPAPGAATPPSPAP